MLTRPYGVNGITGKLIKNSDEADRLHKSNQLKGNTNSGTNTDYLRYGMLSLTPLPTLAYSISFTFNTECYQTRRNLNIAKKYIKFNYKIIREELAKGEGHHLKAIYAMFGCPSHEYDNLDRAIKEAYSNLYNQSSFLNIKVNNVVNKINQVIETDPWLKASCNGYSPVDVVALN